MISSRAVDSAPADAAAASARPPAWWFVSIAGDVRVLAPLLVLVESVHYIFARLLVPLAPPATAAFFMLAIATIEVGALTRRRVHARTFLEHWRFFVTIGVLVGLNTNLGFLGVRYIDPGTAALLTRTSVIFGLVLAVVWLGERLTRVEVAGGALAVVGVFVVGFQPGDYLRLGTLIIVAAGFFYAVHTAVVKRYGGAIPFAEFFFFRLLSTSVVLLVLSAAQAELAWPGTRAWGYLVLAGTLNVVVSRAVYYLALRRLAMSRLTIIATLSPVATIAWSFLLFGSRPSLHEIAGGAAILAGVIVVTASRGPVLHAARSPARPA
jgi:drug/metabolite transporter (DMT)-like permease